MNEKSLLTFLGSILTLFFSSLVTPGNAQVVNFTDANFKAALVSNPAINKNGDGEIQVSEASAYKSYVNVSGKNISNLDGIEAFTEIIGLYCNYNQLTSINISANTKLRALRCDHNNLTTLSVTSNAELTDLQCNVNRLTALDISANTQLSILWCFENQLTGLTTSSAPHLAELRCAFNPITSLDLSANLELVYLDARKANLVSLNVKNGNNTQVTFFDATLNQRLLCIQVDDPSYSGAHWTNIDSRVSFSADCGTANANIVNIPDANFKAALVSNGTINKNNDSEIQVSEAASFSGSMFVAKKNISDLTGIEAFTSLRELHCYENQITHIDLSSNPALIVLRCNDMPLTTLNISGNSNLKSLLCYNTALANIDLSANTNLTTAWLFGNHLTSLDVSASTNLAELQCNHNQLTTLILGSKPALKILLCYGNQLQSLDVTNAPALVDLKCNLNRLTALDVHNSPALRILHCDDNMIPAIDLSANTSLISFRCVKNRFTILDLTHNIALDDFLCSANYQLTFINVKSGHSQEIGYFNAVDNPKLKCIQVDNPAYSRANWSLVDPQVEFKTNCDPGTEIIYIPDPNFKAYLVGLLDGNGETPPDGEIQKYEADISFLDVSNKNIADLTGLESFHHLERFFCSNNQITSIPVGNDNILEYLVCDNNQVTNVIGYLDQVQVFSAKNNKLTELPPGFNSLNFLYLDNNEITSLDVSNLDYLEELHCKHNKLTSLNLKKSTNYVTLSLEATDNPDLTCIEVNDPAYAEANWRDNVDPQANFSTDCPDPDEVRLPDPNLHAAMLEIADGSDDGVRDGKIQRIEAEGIYLADVSNRNITDLTGMEAFRSLLRFRCSHNQIRSIKILGWEDLDCSYNLIDSLPSTNEGLFTLDASHNKIKSVGSGYWNLAYINLDYNELTSFDASRLGVWGTVQCAHNQLTELNFGSVDRLICNNNKLTSIELNGRYVSTLDCSNNELTTLNLTGAGDVWQLLATGNPDLTCIQVNDPAQAETEWRDNVDPQASFSTNCPDPDVVYIPDPNFKAALLEQVDGSAGEAADGEVQYSETEYVWYIVVPNRNIKDLTGIEAFTYLEHLDCANNQISFLPTTSAYYIICNNNQITGFQEMSSVQYLDASHNKLTELPDISYAEGLVLDHNYLTSIDVSGIISLRQLSCTNNNLTSLKTQNQQFDNGFDARENDDLYCIETNDPDYALAHWNADPQVNFSTDCGSSETARAASVSAYPNPTTGKITIQSEQPVGDVQVFDVITGGLKTIQHGNEIDLSHLKNGVYRMNINRGGTTSSVRIIKQ